MKSIGFVNRDNLDEWMNILYKDGKEALCWSNAFPIIVFKRINVTPSYFANGRGRDLVWQAIVQAQEERKDATEAQTV